VSQVVISQQALPDSLLYNNAVKSVKEYYKKEIGPAAMIYNGIQYATYIPRTKGHPFFDKDSLQAGSVFYDGVLYSDIKLKYSLADDRLVMYDYNSNFLFNLHPFRISFFYIGKHCFENIDVAGYAANELVHGFCEVIYKGSIASVYVKKSKKLFQPFSVEDSIPLYKEFINRYITLDTHIYQISGKRSVLSVFNDKRAEIKTFIEANDMGEMNDDNLAKIAAYYESLKH
jgi:hypothetical protein